MTGRFTSSVIQPAPIRLDTQRLELLTVPTHDHLITFPAILQGKKLHKSGIIILTLSIIYLI